MCFFNTLQSSILLFSRWHWDPHYVHERLCKIMGKFRILDFLFFETKNSRIDIFYTFLIIYGYNFNKGCSHKDNNFPKSFNQINVFLFISISSTREIWLVFVVKIFYYKWWKPDVMDWNEILNAVIEYS